MAFMGLRSPVARPFGYLWDYQYRKNHHLVSSYSLNLFPIEAMGCLLPLAPSK